MKGVLKDVTVTGNETSAPPVKFMMYNKTKDQTIQ